MELEEFQKEWAAISINRRVLLSLFLQGKCFQCGKIVSPGSLTLRGEYAYHFLQTHGLRPVTLIDELDNFWRELEFSV